MSRSTTSRRSVWSTSIDAGRASVDRRRRSRARHARQRHPGRRCTTLSRWSTTRADRDGRGARPGGGATARGRGAPARLTARIVSIVRARVPRTRSRRSSSAITARVSLLARDDVSDGSQASTWHPDGQITRCLARRAVWKRRNAPRPVPTPSDDEAHSGSSTDHRQTASRPGVRVGFLRSRVSVRASHSSGVVSPPSPPRFRAPPPRARASPRARS